MSNIQKQHKISPAIAWLTIQKFIIFYCPLDGEHTTLFVGALFSFYIFRVSQYFDVFYDWLISAILFFIFSQGNMLFILYGILTLTLCGGDAFHLVPRIIRAVRGINDKIKRQLGIGLQVSSITMTVFYIILMYIWKFTFPEFEIPVIIKAIIWISAVVRIVICMFPQNNWCTDEGNMKLSIIRNAVFAVTGIGVIILYLISGNWIQV